VFDCVLVRLLVYVRLGRALQRLSQELYSSNTHFVLELVQVWKMWIGLYV
jgi:hypothetical protein